MAYPRIIYNTNNIYVDFDRGIRDLKLPLDESIKTIMSGGGIKEFLHFYQIQSIEFLIQNYTTQFEKLLRAWYNYCRLGNSLKLIIDPDILFFLDFENGIYSNDNIEGTFSYTSAGEYYFEGDNGLLIKNNGLPRYPNGKFGKGMIFENNYDNLQPDFNDLDSWNKTSVTVTEDTTEVDDPIGTNTANKLVPAGGGGACSIHYDTGVALLTGEDIVTSIYMKSLADDVVVYVRLYGESGGWNLVNAYAATVNEGWQRFYVAIESSGSDYTDIRVELSWTNDAANIIYAFYSQLQSLRFPVSVQKQSDGMGSSDSCYWDISNLITQRLTQYSIGFWVKLPYDHNDKISAVYLMIITKSGDSGLHSSMTLEADGDIRCDVGKLDGTNFSATGSASGYLVKDTWCYVVMTVDTTVANGIKLYLNSTLVATSTNSVFAACEGGRLYVGSRTAVSDACDGIIDDFIIESKVLDQTEITRRYNLDKSLGIERNIFDSVFLKEFNFNSSLRNGVPRKSVQLIFEEELT